MEEYGPSEGQGDATRQPIFQPEAHKSNILYGIQSDSFSAIPVGPFSDILADILSYILLDIYILTFYLTLFDKNADIGSDYLRCVVRLCLISFWTFYISDVLSDIVYTLSDMYAEYVF